MKISVIISVALVTQVSASFFDVFQGAVLSVQSSFGKLLSDVVTDVKITVDCTILAVEHVLSLSDDATDRYYEHCKGATKPNATSNNDGHNSGTTTVAPKLEVSIEISHEDLKKNLPAEINTTVNKTLTKILDDYTTKNKLESVENVLAKETERLADVSVLVREELDKLSSEVNSDIKRIEQYESPPTVETVLDKIKVLQDIEQNEKKSTEAEEIHQVVDKVLDKLDIMEVTEASDNVRLEEILRDMESHSDNSFSDLEKQFDEWKEEQTKYLDDIKGKMEDEKEISKHLTFDDTSNPYSESILNNQVTLNNTIFMNNLNATTILFSTKNESLKNTTDYLSDVTYNPLNIISTGLPSNNKTIPDVSKTASDLLSVQINNTEQPVNTSNSVLLFEEPINLVGVQASNVSSFAINPIISTGPEIVITTDSTVMTQNMVTDQHNANPASVDENTTLPISDHDTEASSNTSFLNSFTNYSDKALPGVLKDIEPYNETTVTNSTSETISTNILSSNLDNELDNETTIMDSTVTTYEPFIPQTVLIDKYYDTDEKRTDEDITFDLENPITTSESAIVLTVIHKDYKTIHKPSDDSDSSHDFSVKPLIGVSTKAIPSNLGTSSILRTNEDTQGDPTVYTSDEIDSTTEANKEYLVLTTNTPAHGNDQKVNVAEKMSQDYDAFFHSERKNSPIHKKAVRDARKLIEDSKKTDFIINSILKHKKVGRSIFNYPTRANFGE